jgi:hypothetical protein
MEVQMDENYSKTIERVYQLFRTCPDPNRREDEHGWSIKEILGHLLDSSSNNHQRLVRYKEKDNLDFPGYDQNLFVKRANYQDFDFNFLLLLWYNYNKLLLHIIANIPAEDLHSTITVGDRPAVTIERLIKGYFGHMENHEEQIQRIMGA